MAWTWLDARVHLLRWLAEQHTGRGGFTEVRDLDGRWATYLASDGPCFVGLAGRSGLRVRLHAVGGRVQHHPDLLFRPRAPRALDVLLPELRRSGQGSGPALWTRGARQVLVPGRPGWDIDPDEWVHLDDVRAFELPAPRTARARLRESVAA